MPSDFQIRQQHTIGGVTSSLYDRAVARVSGSPRLSKYHAIIFADWSEGDDHLRWVIRGKVSEIESWAKEIADER
jgi:hypothetical protein